ncbi:unnamed protein product [Zymoseptoria tritici ST99CH_3D1]|nr:unnamed protein product [Zymoseptoria tritici ST99CH_3D1]
MAASLDLGPTPYSDLGLEYNATQPQIDAALARSHTHIEIDFENGLPDDEAHERIRVIGEAQLVLEDGQIRALYDAYLRRVHGVRDFEYPTYHSILQVDKDATEEEANANYEHFMALWAGGRYERVPQMALGGARDRMVARARRAQKDSEVRKDSAATIPIVGTGQAAVVATTEHVQASTSAPAGFAPTTTQTTSKAPKAPKKVKDPDAPMIPKAPKKVKDLDANKSKVPKAPKEPKVPNPAKVTKPQKPKTNKKAAGAQNGAPIPNAVEIGAAPMAEQAAEGQAPGDIQQATNGQNAPVAVMGAPV